jgi:hypothetical protein
MRWPRLWVEQGPASPPAEVQQNETVRIPTVLKNVPAISIRWNVKLADLVSELGKSVSLVAG